jgi:hypothetical protein
MRINFIQINVNSMDMPQRIRGIFGSCLHFSASFCFCQKEIKKLFFKKHQQQQLRIQFA